MIPAGGHYRMLFVQCRKDGPNGGDCTPINLGVAFNPFMQIAALALYVCYNVYALPENEK